MLARLAFRVRALLDALGLVILMFSLVFLLPILVASYYSEPFFNTIRSYLVPMILTANIGLLLWVLGIEEIEMIRDRKLIFAVLLSWVVLMLIPASVILPLKPEYFPVIIIAVIAIVCAVVFIILKYFRRTWLKELRDREAFVCVALGWLAISAFASMPYVFSNTLGYVDSCFESMSGFATCGSTVLETPKGMDYLNVYPHSLMFWRSLTQWLGGLGIIVLSIVVLARAMGAGGARLFRAEVSGKEVTKLKPRIKETASALWKVYLFFTALGFALLIIAGLDGFDALCHAFTSVATGGFSTRYNNIGAYNNWLVEIVIILLMLVGATNFVLHYQFFTGNSSAFLKDPEFKFFIFLVSLATALITINLVFSNYYSPLEALRRGAFQAVSINTASGFATADFAIWPMASQIILLVLMFVGGSVGSTAGGIKVVRSLILLKVARRELRRIIHPKAIEPITLARHPIEEALVHNIIAFFFLYILIFVISAIAIALIENLDIVSSASAVATTMGTVGPGLGKLGPATTFASLLPITKIWLTACMWLGRLEIFACLVLFMPRTYKG